MKQRRTVAMGSSKHWGPEGWKVALLLLVLLAVGMAGPAGADDTDIQIDTVFSSYSATAAHSFSGSLTVGNNSNRYMAFGIALTADTSASGSVMPQVASATWTVGSTVQNFSVRLGQDTTTGSDDTARAEVWHLVAPTVGSGTLKVVLDNQSIAGEVADSSPDGSKTSFSGTLAKPSVEPSTVIFYATVGGSQVTATDNGSGVLGGVGVAGTITYSTGAWSLTYTTAPDSGTNITADYDHQNTAQMVGGAISFYNVHQTTPSTAGASNSGDSTSARTGLFGDQRNLLFGTVATTGPASTLTNYYSSMTERWNHRNGTGNTDTLGAGATRPNTTGDSTSIGWTLGSSRKWAIAAINIQPPGTPTEARFARADALALSDGVLIRWRTGYEVRNLGFRVYREEPSGKRVVITPSVVAGSALFAGPQVEMNGGRAYTFWDSGVRNHASRRYWIQAIDLDGSSRWYGPILSVPASPAEEDRLAVHLGIGERGSPLLSQLGAGLQARQPGSRPRVANSVSPGPVEDQWARAAGPAAKILVSSEGWYRVTRSDLVKAGFDPGPDPVGIHLFAEGIEQAIRVTGVDDGYFDMEDAIEFYGLGLDTPYTGARTYWVTVDGRPGLRIRTAPELAVERPIRLQTVYAETVERRDRTIYVPAIINNGSRDNFYGGVVSPDPLELHLQIDRPEVSGFEQIPPELKVSLQGVTDGVHDVVVSLNGRVVGEMEFEGAVAAEAVFAVAEELGASGNVVTLTARGGDSDVSVLDTVSITYPRAFVVRDDALSMRVARYASIEVTGFHGKRPRVYDVTDPARPAEIPGEVLEGESGEGYRITVPGTWVNGGSEAVLHACSEESVRRPDAVVANVPSDWHSAHNGADLVILTHPDFIEAAEVLAGHRRSQGLEVAVVPVRDVYDEFSYGEKDPAAIRSFLARAVEAWKTPPRYVVLLGDASFDPRNYLGKGAFDFVPTHIQPTILLKTASDDWFGVFEGDSRPELAIGRIPVRTPEAANAVVEKIIRYDTADGTGWADDVLLVADRDSEGFSFEKAVDQLAPLVPDGLATEELFIGNEGEEAAREKILGAFDEGRLVINYVGHGSQTIWTNHGVLESEDVGHMTNGDRLPAVIAMNCLNGFFHDVQQQSLAEVLLLHSEGGAVAVWASTALTDPEGQARLNEVLYSRLFDGEANPRVGDAIVAAKAAITDPYVRSSWVFFGDPSMRLKR